MINRRQQTQIMEIRDTNTRSRADTRDVSRVSEDEKFVGV